MTNAVSEGKQSYHNCQLDALGTYYALFRLSHPSEETERLGRGTYSEWRSALYEAQNLIEKNIAATEQTVAAKLFSRLDVRLKGGIDTKGLRVGLGETEILIRPLNAEEVRLELDLLIRCTR